ncbi:MAG TPA: hypothetical protein PLZ51_02840, partial [Aggregatilineales bacterium]|nr:hypothetical protein [Aggregatilineales bacterium]
VGVNTPERGEACYDDAVNANRDLVQGETVTLVIDTATPTNMTAYCAIFMLGIHSSMMNSSAQATQKPSVMLPTMNFIMTFWH